MQNNKNLLEEMKKIKKISNPDLVILTLDALAGTDILSQAKLFDEAVNINGYIVTKIDADAKGGGIISLLSDTKKPILYVGTEKDVILDIKEFFYDVDLQKFIRIIDGKEVSGLEIKRSIRGYTILDSLNAILKLTSFDYFRVYGWSTTDGERSDLTGNHGTHQSGHLESSFRE